MIEPSSIVKMGDLGLTINQKKSTPRPMTKTKTMIKKLQLLDPPLLSPSLSVLGISGSMCGFSSKLEQNCEDDPIDERLREWELQIQKCNNAIDLNLIC